MISIGTNSDFNVGDWIETFFDGELTGSVLVVADDGLFGLATVYPAVCSAETGFEADFIQI